MPRPLNLAVEQAKAVLARQQMATRGIQLERFAPGETLAAFVNHYWCVQWDLPDGVVHKQGVLSHPCQGIAVEDGRAYVYGVSMGTSIRQLIGKGIVFAAMFRPGGFYPFYRKAVAQLTARELPLEQVFGANTLAENILAFTSPGDMLPVMESFLLQRLPEPDPQAELVSQIVQEMAGDRHILRVEDVVSRFGLSPRSLQRLFHIYVGVTPKSAIQQYRLHEAADQLAAGGFGSLARLAQQLGYYDQAHFVRDFKQVIGLTPSQYLEQIKAPVPNETR